MTFLKNYCFSEVTLLFFTNLGLACLFLSIFLNYNSVLDRNWFETTSKEIPQIDLLGTSTFELKTRRPILITHASFKNQV